MRRRKKMHSLDALSNVVHRLGSYINAPVQCFPYFQKCTHLPSLWSGVVQIEIKRREYHYVVTDRGMEFQRFTFQNVEDLLFKIFSKITQSMASDFAAKRPDQNDEFRKIMFARQVELLGQIDCRWAQRRAAQIEDILYHHPYSDA